MGDSLQSCILCLVEIQLLIRYNQHVHRCGARGADHGSKHGCCCDATLAMLGMRRICNNHTHTSNKRDTGSQITIVAREIMPSLPGSKWGILNFPVCSLDEQFSPSMRNKLPFQFDRFCIPHWHHHIGRNCIPKLLKLMQIRWKQSVVLLFRVYCIHFHSVALGHHTAI